MVWTRNTGYWSAAVPFHYDQSLDRFVKGPGLRVNQRPTDNLGEHVTRYLEALVEIKQEVIGTPADELESGYLVKMHAAFVRLNTLELQADQYWHALYDAFGSIIEVAELMVTRHYPHALEQLNQCLRHGDRVNIEELNQLTSSLAIPTCKNLLRIWLSSFDQLNVFAYWDIIRQELTRQPAVLAEFVGACAHVVREILIFGGPILQGATVGLVAIEGY